MTRRDPQHAVATAPASDLAQLVATEQSLEQRLADARQQARTLLAAARTACDASLQQFESTLGATRLERARQLNLEQDASRRRVLDEGGRKAAWYEDLPASTQDELAAWVVERLLRGAGP
ncbi:MAG: hypothetical protein U0133_07480 [Gemmatimonadales bacterium]